MSTRADARLVSCIQEDIPFSRGAGVSSEAADGYRWPYFCFDRQGYAG